MDNEAPNYAQWIPEAGGYVANGNVVSKSPIYEENGSGRMKIKVDASVFGNTTPQNSSTSKLTYGDMINALPSVPRQATLASSTTNTEGSGTDANAAMTGVGSLGSLNLNTANTDNSAISSPATKSIVAGNPILSPEDEVNKEYQDAVGRNDLQGQINALTKASRLTGADYSSEIDRLTKERQQKIQTIDDRYLQAINEAKYYGDTTGDYTQYNQLMQQQGQWRDQVGYQDAIKQKYDTQMQELKIDYDNSYLAAVQTIGNQLMQMLPSILNFQYNPYQDTALQMAQGYAVSRVKEQMNSTGMYYSSMTQNAITKAVGELVPVYQKMAREEAMENFKLLQQTASFLMDLEQTQFNMWKSQIQLQFDANAEKRAQVDQAIQNANARGYYTNEEAALLGVEPGSPSQASRERALDKQEQLEKEQRQLYQNQVMAQFNSELAVQEYAAKQKIAAEYEVSTYAQKQAIANQYDLSAYRTKLQYDNVYKNPTNLYKNNSGNVVTYNPGQRSSLNGIYASLGGNPTQIAAVTKGSTGDVSFPDKLTGSTTKADLKNNIQSSASSEGLTENNKLGWLEDAITNGKNYDDVWSAITQAQVDQSGAKYSVYDQNVLNSLQGTAKEKLQQLQKYLTATALAETNNDNIYKILDEAANRTEITHTVKDKLVNATLKNTLSDVTFSTNEEKNYDNVNKAMEEIEKALPYMTSSQAADAYINVFDNIATTKNFDFDKRNVTFNAGDGKSVIDMGFNPDEYFSINDKGDKSKQQAMVYMINKIGGYNGQTSPVTSDGDRAAIVKKLVTKLQDYANNDLKNGYIGLKDAGNYATSYVSSKK